VSERDLVAQAVAGRRVGPSGWVRANCPLCVLVLGKVDRKASLGFNTASGDYHCFKCSSKGWLSGDYEARPAQQEEGAPEPIAPPEGFTPLFEGRGVGAESLASARNYVLGKRRVPENVACQVNIGACLGGRFGGRVVVPVTDREGAWRWFVARAYTPSEKPYLYPLGSRGGVMFNEQALFVETDEPATIMEGCFDAVSDWPHGVAVLGKPTQDHIKRLARAKRPLVVMLDGDVPDEAYGLALALHLEGCTRVGLVQLGARVDPDELPPGEVRRLAREACAGIPV